MDTDVVVRGKVIAVKEQRDPQTKAVRGHSIQMLKRNGRNAFDLLNVKLPEGADPTKYTEGTSVELAVDVSAFENNIYYRATRDVLAGKADTRAQPRSATAG
jgi:hypothetical protein